MHSRATAFNRGHLPALLSRARLERLMEPPSNRGADSYTDPEAPTVSRELAERIRLRRQSHPLAYPLVLPGMEPGGRAAESYADLLRCLASPDGDIQGAASWVLYQLDYKKAVPALMSVVTDRNLDSGGGHSAAQALANLGDLRTAEALADLLLTAPEVRTRELAAIGLQNMMGKPLPTAKLVIALLKATEDASVLLWIAEALGYNGDRSAVLPLIEVLKHPSAEVRFWSAFALGLLGDKRARGPLLRLAYTDTVEVPQFWRVCDEARSALRDIRDRSRWRWRE